jgi:hypothetical protein
MRGQRGQGNRAEVTTVPEFSFGEDPFTPHPTPGQSLRGLGNQITGNAVSSFVVKKIIESGIVSLIGGPVTKVIDVIVTGGPGEFFVGTIGQGEEAALAAAFEAQAATAAALAMMNGGLRQNMAATDP